MPALNPYLNFNGNAEEVFNFYKSVFGGEFTTVMRFKDVPDEYKMGEGDAEKIMHMQLPIGNNSFLMGSDVPEAYGKTVPGSNFNISVNVDTEEEANNIFNGLSAGGHAIMPMNKTFWGSYFGMLKDKYDIHWMISYDAPPQQ